MLEGQVGPLAHTARRLLVGVLLPGVLVTAVACDSAESRHPAAARSSEPAEMSPLLRVEPVRAYVTGYSYFDNTPPGSVRISHPVLHATAGGTGSYDDPVTVAVGYVREDGGAVLDWSAGTRFYVPNLRRYLVVEDTCGDGETPQDGPCHTGYPSGASTWLDVWVGGEGGSERAADRCMAALSGIWDVVVDPEPGYAVDPGEISPPDGCSHQYGDELVLDDVD